MYADTNYVALFGLLQRVMAIIRPFNNPSQFSSSRALSRTTPALGIPSETIMGVIAKHCYIHICKSNFFRAFETCLGTTNHKWMGLRKSVSISPYFLSFGFSLIISTLLFLNCWHFKAASWVKRSEAAKLHTRHLSASHHLRTRELNISDMHFTASSAWPPSASKLFKLPSLKKPGKLSSTLNNKDSIFKESQASA